VTILTPIEIRTCWSITHVYETGRARGNYSGLAVLDDNAGVSYGTSQATDGSGALDEIVARYTDQQGEYSAALKPYLPTLADPLCPLRNNDRFKQLLVDAGTDPVMRQIQDEVFSELYWEPARNQAEALHLVEPLSYACLYDLAIQSGHGRLARLRRKFPELPPVRGGEERAWTRALNDTREYWLGTLRSYAARRSIYRTISLRTLMNEDCWLLELPLNVRGVKISEDEL